MSREILFKAKWLDNGEWVEGDLLRETNAFGEKLIQIFVDDSNGYWSKYEVDPSTVCQYTNRNDCKGRKIYDGDIVDRYNHTHNRHMRGIIKFGEYSMPTDAYRIRKGTHLGFYIYWMDEDIRDTYRCDFAWYANALEVIGNIWDTPELLEYADGNAAQYADNPTLAPAT